MTSLTTKGVNVDIKVDFHTESDTDGRAGFILFTIFPSVIITAFRSSCSAGIGASLIAMEKCDMWMAKAW